MQILFLDHVWVNKMSNSSIRSRFFLSEIWISAKKKKKTKSGFSSFQDFEQSLPQQLIGLLRAEAFFKVENLDLFNLWWLPFFEVIMLINHCSNYYFHRKRLKNKWLSDCLQKNSLMTYKYKNASVSHCTAYIWLKNQNDEMSNLSNVKWQKMSFCN